MKVKLLIAVAAFGCLLSIGSVEAQSRYSQPDYRTASTRTMNYNRSSTVVTGEEHGGCAACGREGSRGCGECDACRSGCGRCCRPHILGWVARGVGRVADGIGATLDCLFPSSCCQSNSCEPACCARRLSCGTRACQRRGGGADCCDAGCAGRGGGDAVLESMDGEEHDVTPVAPKSAPVPTPAPDTAQGARQYRPLPPARTTTTRPRNAAAAVNPAKKLARAATIPATAEEEVYTTDKAPRPLSVRAQEATRLVPIVEQSEEFETEEQPVRQASVRNSNPRIPTNPLRSR